MQSKIVPAPGVFRRNPAIDDIILGRTITAPLLDKGLEPVTYHYSKLPLDYRCLFLRLLCMAHAAGVFHGHDECSVINLAYSDMYGYFCSTPKTVIERNVIKQHIFFALATLSETYYPYIECPEETVPMCHLYPLLTIALLPVSAKKCLTTEAKKAALNRVSVFLSPKLKGEHKIYVPAKLFTLSKDVIFKLGYRLLVHSDINTGFKHGYDTIAATRSYNKFFNRVIGLDALLSSIGFEDDPWIRTYSFDDGKTCLLEALTQLRDCFQFSICHGVGSENVHYLLSGDEFSKLGKTGLIEDLFDHVPLYQLLKYKLFFNVINNT
jgi:hypothetical protein